MSTLVMWLTWHCVNFPLQHTIIFVDKDFVCKEIHDFPAFAESVGVQLPDVQVILIASESHMTK